MLMALDLKRTYTAILDNAYQVSYEKIENKIGSLDFTMPLDDPKNEFIAEMQWVELTDNENEYIGLYRVMPTTILSYLVVTKLKTKQRKRPFNFY